MRRIFAYALFLYLLYRSYCRECNFYLTKNFSSECIVYRWKGFVSSDLKFCLFTALSLCTPLETFIWLIEFVFFSFQTNNINNMLKSRSNPLLGKFTTKIQIAQFEITYVFSWDLRWTVLSNVILRLTLL